MKSHSVNTVRALATIPVATSLVWSDEFDGPAGQLISSSNWSYHVGRYGAPSGELQYYTNATAANCSLDGNSNLVIKAINQTPPDSQSAPYNYTSARIHTRNKRGFAPTAQQPIRIAARMKIPRTTGLLPAFWTIGVPDDWPHAGEIDLMELPAQVGDHTMVANLHGPTQGAPTSDKNVGAGSYKHYEPLSADFHVIGIDWYTDRMMWHFDSVVTGQITQAQYTAANGDWTAFNGGWQHYLLLNIAVGNDWTGVPDASSVFPQSMIIDWVRVWNI